MTASLEGLETACRIEATLARGPRQRPERSSQFRDVGRHRAQLTTAADIMGALAAGREVRAVFHYKNMTLVDDKGQPMAAPDAIGGMTLDTFEYFAKGSIRMDETFSTEIADGTNKGGAAFYASR